MNKPLAPSLKFADMFALAASAWPAEMHLVHQPSNSGGDPSAYVVEDLDIDDGDAFIGAPDEVLIRNMFDAVYEALHAWAAGHASVRPLELASEVRPRFERRLRATAAAPALGDWRPQDVALIHRYFEANAEAA